MARCSTKTGLPLDTWAAILGISPWEFNQCDYPSPKSAQCKDVLYQFPWQHDHLSREEIGEAIADAELMLAQELLYWPSPHYMVSEVVPYPRPYDPTWFGYGGDIRGYQKSVQLKYHRVISGGAMNRTFIGQITLASGDLVKLDEDGDGVFETFQATITDTAIGDLTDPYELALYFSADVRHGEKLDETWRIRPLTIAISGDTATIRGHRTLLINPQIEFRADAQKLNPATDANYVVTVECYRTFTDTTATLAQPYQGIAEWKTVPGCEEGCTYAAKELCLGVDANDTGYVYADYGTPSTWPYKDRDPDRLRVNYYAGFPLVDGQMDDELARMVTYLSVSLLANERCGCDRSNRIIARWKQPIVRFQDDNGEGAQAFTAQRNVFPMTVGGQYAYNRVRRMRDLEAVGI